MGKGGGHHRRIVRIAGDDMRQQSHQRIGDGGRMMTLLCGPDCLAELQHDLAEAYIKVGDVLVAQSKLEEALKAYRDSLAIMERPAASDPSNTEWQRDLAVSHGKTRHSLRKQGNIARALAELRKGRDIMTALVAIAPDVAQWKNDLAWFDEQIARLEGQARDQIRN